MGKLNLIEIKKNKNLFKTQKKIKNETLETGINLAVVIDIENGNQIPATTFTVEETFQFFMAIVMVTLYNQLKEFT